MLPIVLLALLAGPLGIADRFARLVIATNWLTLALAYLTALPFAVALMTGEASETVLLLSLVVLLATVWLFFRVARLALDGDGAMATAITAAMVLLSFFVTGGLQSLMGVGAP